MNNRVILKAKIERLEKKSLRLNEQIQSLNAERNRVLKRTRELQKRLAAPLAEDKSRRVILDTVIESVRRRGIIIGPFPHPGHGRPYRWAIYIGPRKLKQYYVGQTVTVEFRFEAREASSKRTWLANLLDNGVEHHQLHEEHPGYDA
jgi:hypothetical protein